MATMTTTDPKGGLTMSPATERAPQPQHGRQVRWRALTRHFVVLLLFVKLHNYSILFILLSPLFECWVLCQCPLSPAGICHWHLCWPSLPSILHRHCPMLTLTLVYPGSWNELTVSLSWSVLTVSLSSPIAVVFHLTVALLCALPPPALLLRNDCHCLSCTLFNCWLLCVFYNLYNI
jgi:hypothetical protein